MSTELSSQAASLPLPAQFFQPKNTLNCVGPAAFRSQTARDAACLLDLDETVVSWSCLSHEFRHNDCVHIPDFMVERDGGLYAVDILGPIPLPEWIEAAVKAKGFGYFAWSADDLPQVRVQNARDLLRYARYEVSLVDRLLILTALKEHGSMRLSEVITMAPGTRAIAVIAAMILRGQIETDLDEQLIGPDSVIRSRHY
ncbi:hypothetical protein [Sinorhizobium fredii]|uniref:hypothetical protein n=1 Tax=Rhizobium fredii TaxID=380 RepID=UPI003514B71E